MEGGGVINHPFPPLKLLYRGMEGDQDVPTCKLLPSITKSPNCQVEEMMQQLYSLTPLVDAGVVDGQWQPPSPYQAKLHPKPGDL